MLWKLEFITYVGIGKIFANIYAYMDITDFMYKAKGPEIIIN